MGNVHLLISLYLTKSNQNLKNVLVYNLNRYFKVHEIKCNQFSLIYSFIIIINIIINYNIFIIINYSS